MTKKSAVPPLRPSAAKVAIEPRCGSVKFSLRALEAEFLL